MFNFLKHIFYIKPKKKHTLEDLSKMDKEQLEKVGRQYGLELDRRKTHEKILKQLWRHIVKTTKEKK